MDSKEVDVDENGEEVVRLRGPWQVRTTLVSFTPLYSTLTDSAMFLRFIYVRICVHALLQVHVLGALPLRNLSRLWGYLNSLELPIWLRPYGFRLYAKVFGCNLEEIEIEDLTQYKSLGDFFYRKLKDGVRPVANAPLVCNSLHFLRFLRSSHPILSRNPHLSLPPCDFLLSDSSDHSSVNRRGRLIDLTPPGQSRRWNHPSLRYHQGPPS